MLKKDFLNFVLVVIVIISDSNSASFEVISF